MWRSVAEQMRSAFFERSPPMSTDASYTNVAVHIRRGDTLRGATALKRHMGPAMLHYFRRVVEKLRSRYAATPRPARFTLVSDERNGSALLEVLGGADVALSSSPTPFEDFRRMVAADVLAISPSGFSLVAAYLNRGKVVAPACMETRPGWDSPHAYSIGLRALPEWELAECCPWRHDQDWC